MKALSTTRVTDGWDVRTDTGDVLHWPATKTPPDEKAVTAGMAGLLATRAAEATAKLARDKSDAVEAVVTAAVRSRVAALGDLSKLTTAEAVAAATAGVK
jgi:hypothetical protein